MRRSPYEKFMGGVFLAGLLCLAFNSYLQYIHQETAHCQWFSYKSICLEEDEEWPTIDLVYTWVNGSDPVLAAQLRHAKGEPEPGEEEKPSDKASASRFADNEELRYSLRSIEKYAPWVRHIYLVTNGQVPNWLDTDHPKLTIATHEQIFLNSSHLPTFSSPAIESHLHRLPGLAKHFVYFNDDVMLGAPTYPDDFKTLSEGTKIFFSWGVPQCNEGCPYYLLGDGKCDEKCNATLCAYDKGDCLGDDVQYRHSMFAPSGGRNQFSLNSFAQGGRTLGQCAPLCPDTWVGDGFCDQVCKSVECGFDGGDCEEAFSMMESVTLFNDTTLVVLDEVPSLLLNTSVLAAEGHVVSASYANTELIRTATVSSIRNFIDLTFHAIPEDGDGTHNMTILVEVCPEEIQCDSPSQHLFDFMLKRKPPSDPEPFVDLEDIVPIEDPLMNELHINSNQSLPLKVLHAPLSTREEDLEDPYGFDTFTDVDVAVAAEQPGSISLNSSSRKKQPRRAGRNLLDTFGDSLRFVDFKFSEEFGYASRKVPAHMPHMINKDLMKILQAKYEKEWDETSSHQFRASNDMQYAFSYFYYLINQPPLLSAERLFNISDVDNDRILDENELRSVILRAWGHPIKEDQFSQAKRVYEFLARNVEGKITLEVFAEFEELLEKLRGYYEPRLRNKYETFNADNVAFVMVNQNDTKLQEKLDGIRERQHKFICLNDNIDHSDPKADEALQLVHDLYKSIVPLRSSFELPDDQLNQDQYIDDIQARKYYGRMEFILLSTIGVSIFLYMILSFIKMVS